MYGALAFWNSSENPEPPVDTTFSRASSWKHAEQMDAVENSTAYGWYLPTISSISGMRHFRSGGTVWHLPWEVSTFILRPYSWYLSLRNFSKVLSRIAAWLAS